MNSRAFSSEGLLRTRSGVETGARAVAPLKPVSIASQSISQAIPLYTNGMRIGLLGGSFNPPHIAHRAISLFAIKRLKLDRVWWLVTPGNPLKDHGPLHDLDERADAARQMANDPRIDVSCLEAVIGTQIYCRHDYLSAPPHLRLAPGLDHGR